MTEKQYPSDLDKSMGRNLTKFRKSYGLSRAELSCSMNISYKTLWQYENGFNSISIQTLIKIQEAFNKYNVTLEDVFRLLVVKTEEDSKLDTQPIKKVIQTY